MFQPGPVPTCISTRPCSDICIYQDLFSSLFLPSPVLPSISTRHCSAIHFYWTLFCDLFLPSPVLSFISTMHFSAIHFCFSAIHFYQALFRHLFQQALFFNLFLPGPVLIFISTRFYSCYTSLLVRLFDVSLFPLLTFRISCEFQVHRTHFPHYDFPKVLLLFVSIGSKISSLLTCSAHRILSIPST